MSITGTLQRRRVRVWFGSHVIANYCAEPELAERSGALGQARFEIGDRAQHAPALAKHLAALCGQRRRLGTAIEQGDAERRLEVLDAPRHRRLRQVEPQRRAVDRPRFRHRDERLHVPDVHAGMV